MEERRAFGGPGIEPRWSHGNKIGVGTAYSGDSKLWYTLFRGIVTEVYFPLIDHPQLRDLQFLVSDGARFVHEERRHLQHRVARLDRHSLGFKVDSADPEGRYLLRKEIIADPHLPCLLEHVTVRGPGGADPDPLTLYLLAAPHLDGGGWGNTGRVVDVAGRRVLLAEKDGTALALAASRPFAQASCGYVGRSDAWTDVTQHLGMEWEFDLAENGNIALAGAFPFDRAGSMTVHLALGRGRQHALSVLLQSLSTPYEEHRRRFLAQWERAGARLRELGPRTARHDALYRGSYGVLLAHEDKTFPGAFIASLSIPWGYARSDDDRGGYHLVWTRDLVQIALGLLSAGDRETPLRTLIYLAASQRPDGSFPQNFWLNAEPYWAGVQLDEVAFPILLAGRLAHERALAEFDPYPMALRAARFLIERGPATQQERWEEATGFSPSTLAVSIAALVVAAGMAHDRHDRVTASFLETHADFLESHLERWTVTHRGTLLPGVTRHYVRVRPIDLDDPEADEDRDDAPLALANQPPGAPREYPANSIVDAGFLELVRYGVRPPDDPIVADSVRVVDAVLKVETPLGPCWRRYNHDGYGQHDDGGAFFDYGTGRAWPLLTGERAHFELARGADVAPLLEALGRFATDTGLFPEQVWDGPELPGLHLEPGRPTGAAMPLAWAHAEYLKLLRSVDDGRVFDRVAPVERRYQGKGERGPPTEIWKPSRRPRTVPSTSRLRIVAPEPFRLHWSDDGWAHPVDTDATPTALGLVYVDLPPLGAAGRSHRFTFYWPGRGAWEGRDYEVRSV